MAPSPQIVFLYRKPTWRYVRNKRDLCEVFVSQRLCSPLQDREVHAVGSKVLCVASFDCGQRKLLLPACTCANSVQRLCSLAVHAGIAEIVDQKQSESGRFSFYVHYVDCKFALTASCLLPSSSSQAMTSASYMCLPVETGSRACMTGAGCVCAAVDKRLDEWVTADKVSVYDGAQTSQQPLLSHVSSGLA